MNDTDTKRIGIIGSGDIGTGIARLAVAAGYDVLIANSRGPKSLRGLVEELGQVLFNLSEVGLSLIVIPK